ncbi:GntR family transcriptional regulator [Saccharibacillus sp. JS10]|uniref:GntR family transcriptional regulator n=1 Tax=Saccharibacillus sp. JS10 TaxID=2950552 RepID=UPI00210CC455|nr:GntR family transcriptional regulator [Saccharibacillus sp. JS10]MCQ4086498.1 GntR family transcriptional regulator [Saccharibacillus sp. JS10]
MHYPSAWLQGSSRGESIASHLRLQIINESIKPGEILSENKVAELFEASRSPVREAFKLLAGEGLIRLERMGAVVVGLDLTHIQELYDVRYLIESFAQQRLAKRDNAAMLVRLEQTVDRMKLAVKHGDEVEFAFQDFSFHEMIVQEAGHTRIWHLWNSIRSIVRTVMLLTTANSFRQGKERMEWVADKHLTVIEGLRSGNEEQIAKIVKAYFADSDETLGRSLS